jgi:hypothetical protein
MRKLKYKMSTTTQGCIGFVNSCKYIEVVSISFNANTHEYDIFYYDEACNLTATISGDNLQFILDRNGK